MNMEFEDYAQADSDRLFQENEDRLEEWVEEDRKQKMLEAETLFI